MKTKRILFGTLTGTVALFFLGWGIYGVALNDYMSTSTSTAVARPMEQMLMWAFIVSNFAWALLLTLVLEWSSTQTAMSGARTGAILGFLAVLAFDLSSFATTTMYLGLKVIAVDALGFAVMSAIGAAVIAWVMQKASAPSVAAA